MLVRPVALVCIALAGVWAGCEREVRSFHASTPDTQNPLIRQSSLQPGVASGEPEKKTDYERNAYSLAEGKRLFSAFNCTGCHANGGGDKGPALIDEKWIYGGRVEQIFASIMEGRPNGMPSFRGKVSADQAWQLAAYVRSLSGQIAKDTAPQRSDHMKSNPPENSIDPVKPRDAGSPK